MLEATFALFILMLTLLPLANLLNDTSAIISTDRSQVTAIYLANNYLSAYRAEAAKTTNSTFPGTAPALVSPQLVGTTEFTITLPQPPGWCLFTDSGGTGVWGNGTPLTPSNAGYWVVVDVTWGNKAHLVTEAALLTMPPNMASSSAAPPGVPLSATACPV